MYKVGDAVVVTGMGDNYGIIDMVLPYRPDRLPSQDYYGVRFYSSKTGKPWETAVQEQAYYQGADRIQGYYDGIPNLDGRTNLDKYDAIVKKLRDTYEAKNHDYGDSFHSTYLKHGAIAGIIRMEDKIARASVLASGKVAKVDEKLQDTLLGLANYAIMLAMEVSND